MSNVSPLAALRDSLARDRAALHAAVDRVPAALRTQKPAPDQWSVQEVLEHLTLVEGRSAMLVRALAEAAPSFGDAAAVDPTAVDRSLFSNRAMKISAPEPIQPTGTMSVEAALAALESARAQLLAVLDAAEGRDLSKVSRPHPALGPLDGYQWIGALGGHEMRHTLQIDDIHAALTRGPR